MNNNILFEAFNHWQGILILGLLALIYIAVIIMQVLKNKHTLVISMIMGLLLGFIYLYISTNIKESAYSQNLVDSIYMWLTMAWNIFMILLLVILPIYIFAMVSTTFTNSRHQNSSKGLILKSFFTLWSMTLLGILMAIAFFPIMYLLKDYLQLTGQLASQDATGIFGGIWPGLERAMNTLFVHYGIIVIVSIGLAILFAVIMNILHMRWHSIGEPLISFIEHIKSGIRIYLKYVSKLIPYVISGMLVVLFANYNNAFTDTLQSLLLFTLIFFIGLIIVWSIEYGIVNSLKDKTKWSKKEFRKKTKEYMINDFAIQSAPILLPITIAYVKDLGVKEQVVKTTPILSTFMGYSMCGGFYPMLIVLFTLLQGSPFVNPESTASLVQMIIIISLAVPLIMIMTLGMTGVPGADVAIIFGLLSALGLNPSYFFTIYLIEPMLDKFRGVGNSMGFAAASVITDKLSDDNEVEERFERLYNESVNKRKKRMNK